MAVSNANALIRPLSELFEVHLSHPYNATGQTNDFKGHSPVARLVFSDVRRTLFCAEFRRVPSLTDTAPLLR